VSVSGAGATSVGGAAVVVVGTTVPELSVVAVGSEAASPSKASELALRAAMIDSYAFATCEKMSAGKVPPSTGAPANSVSIGWTVSG
jgi:hypothetical protein